MDTIIIVAVAVLPALLLWLYIWMKDPQKEPTHLLLKATVWGVMICFPVAVVEAGISAVLYELGLTSSGFFATTVQAFFVAALPEESAKLLMLWLILRKNPYFDEHFDGIVYAVCIGLGFAAVENLFYILDGGEKWLTVATVRALLSVPGHYAFAVIMGYYYSAHHFFIHTRWSAVLILLMPVLAHGIYDAIAMMGEETPIVGGMGFFLLVYACIKMHRFAINRIDSLIERDSNNPISQKHIM